jgi:Cell division protein CrgA
VPESRPRKRQAFTPPPARKPVRVGGPRWVAPVMVTCWLVGLSWIVLFYLAGDNLKYFRDIGNWNLVVGMGLIATGFVLSTKWE